MRIGVVAVLMGGCSLFGTTPPPRAEPAVPAEPGPERCEDWRAPAKRRWPSVAELRATLGQPVSSKAVARLAKALGPGEYRADALQSWYAFRDGGVMLQLERAHDGERVARIQLFGRGEHRYGGELPEGLHFSHDRAKLEQLIGGGDRPDSCSYGLVPCVYKDRGLEVDATGVVTTCVSRVDLFPPMGPQQVAFDDLYVESGERDGAHGVILRGRPRFGHVEEASDVTVVFRLRTAEGAPVREAYWRLRAESQKTEVALEPTAFLSWSLQFEAFVPYVAFDLPAGSHALVAELAATRRRRSSLFSSSAGSPEELEVVGTRTMPVALEMPAITEVRFGVREVILEPGEYDDIRRSYGIAAVVTGGATALFVPPEHWKLPDPMWEVTVAGSTAYESEARQDVLRASWSGKTPWLRLAPGDRLILSIEDDDAGNGEVLETMTYDADTLAAAAAKPWVSEGSVRKVRLSSVERR